LAIGGLLGFSKFDEVSSLLAIKFSQLWGASFDCGIKPDSRGPSPLAKLDLFCFVSERTAPGFGAYQA
jgi:hypothetical protein